MRGQDRRGVGDPREQCGTGDESRIVPLREKTAVSLDEMKY